MSRKTFLSKESFVDATEKQTREKLARIPEHLSNITLVAENKINDSLRFLYESIESRALYQVEVSVLPLNDQFTRISLHASHTSGAAFHEDPDLSTALNDFESAVHAAIKDDLINYRPLAFKAAESSNWLHSLTNLGSLCYSMLFRKKLS
jgi:hypothetical protein